MALFKYKKQTAPPVVVTPERAEEIYAIYQTGVDETTAFTEHNVPFAESKLVWAEIKRIENEVISKMSGTFVITPGVPAVYEGEKLIKPEVAAVYYKVTTEKALAESLTGVLLDAGIVLTDVRRFSDGNPDDYPDWKTWKASFVELLEPEPLPW